MTYQPCNAARLFEAILGSEQEEQIRKKLGLPFVVKDRRQRHCRTCGEPIQTTNITGYCRPCKDQSTHILIACSECDRLFKIRATDAIYRINKMGYQHSFCSKQCQGKWLGKHYGFSKNFLKGEENENQKGNRGSG